MKANVLVKRVYDDPAKTDGYRVLVDGLWPRGMKKDELSADEWVKDLAPSPDLRKWFGHKPERWPEFKKRYRSELEKNKAVDLFIGKHRDKKVITLLYSAKDNLHNNALVLQDFLKKYQGRT